MLDKNFKELFVQRAEARVDSKARLICEATGQKRTDAGVAFTVGQLEKMETQIWETLYQSASEAFELLPVKPSFEPAAEDYSWRLETETGLARVGHEMAGDPPYIDTSLAKFITNVLTIDAAYRYTVGDGQRAGLLGYDHAAAKARAAARAVMRKHNDMAFTGDTDSASNKPKGLFNHPLLSDTALTDGDWTTFTAANAYADITDVLDKVSEQSKGVHNPTDLVLSLALYNMASSARIDSTSGQSVLDAVKANYPGLSVHRVAAASGAGASAKDRIMAFEKNADNLELIVPVLFDETAPQQSFWTFNVGVMGKNAGLILRRPMAVAQGSITVV